MKLNAFEHIAVDYMYVFVSCADECMRAIAKRRTKHKLTLAYIVLVHVVHNIAT